MSRGILTDPCLIEHIEVLGIRYSGSDGDQPHRVYAPKSGYPRYSLTDVETEMAEEVGSEMAGPVRASPSVRQTYSRLTALSN